MESKGSITSLGNSVLVPSVQQLVQDNSLNSIPQRYIRPDFEPIRNRLNGEEIPIVDFQRLLDPESTDSELSNLDFACKNWGFFQLVNHGASSSLLEKVKKESQELFNLPIEEKKKLWQYEGEVEGFGQLFVVSEEQKLDWSDMFYMVTQPLHLRKLHLFPNLPLPFRETIDKYSSEVKKLAVAIFEKIARALKIKEEEMEEYCKEVWQSVRINYYPRCKEPEKVIGLTPHSDGGALTILLQVNDVEGLEIMKDGHWVSVKPLPNAFIINLGDILEVITNGEYKSIMHRATVNSTKERMSIATFHSPRYDCEIGPASSLLAYTNQPPLYKTLTVEQFYKGFFARQLYAKSYLQTLRI